MCFSAGFRFTLKRILRWKWLKVALPTKGFIMLRAVLPCLTFLQCEIIRATQHLVPVFSSYMFLFVHAFCPQAHPNIAKRLMERQWRFSPAELVTNGFSATVLHWITLPQTTPLESSVEMIHVPFLLAWDQGCNCLEHPYPSCKNLL